MLPQDEVLANELEWLREFTPATRRAATSLPSLAGERLLVVCHLDLKMIPYFQALLSAGAQVHACAANPATTREEVAAYLESSGVVAPARRDDPPERHAGYLRAAIEAGNHPYAEKPVDVDAPC